MIEVGQVIDGKYRVEQLVGQGGMGSVYAARHMHIGRRVALKVLHLSAGPEMEVVKRFEREAQAAARIGNDHILDVVDFGSLEDGSRYIVCEFLEGETLAARLERNRRLTPDELIPIARQLLNGLAAAHAAGVVHRDLKPDNIFLLRHKAGWADFVKIIDFGISKFQAIAGDESGMRMTATGVVMGTPFYLSPEQARGTHDADHRSDLYSVGVILYEAVTGTLPFKAQNFNDLIFKIVLESPLPPNQVAPDVDPAFSQIIMKAMARDPADRFQTAAELSETLGAWARAAGLSITGPNVTSDNNRTSSDALPVQVRLPTPASWGGTQPAQESVVFRPRRTGLIASLALLGLLVCGGLAYGVHAALNDHPDNKTASSSQPSATPRPVPSQAVPVVSTAEPNNPPPSLDSEGVDAGFPSDPSDIQPPQPVFRPAAPSHNFRPAQPRPARPQPAAVVTPQPAAPAHADKPASRPGDALGY